MEIDSLEAEEDGVSVITIVLNTVETPEIVEFLGTERVGDVYVLMMQTRWCERHLTRTQ